MSEIDFSDIIKHLDAQGLKKLAQQAKDTGNQELLALLEPVQKKQTEENTKKHLQNLKNALSGWFEYDRVDITPPTSNPAALEDESRIRYRTDVTIKNDKTSEINNLLRDEDFVMALSSSPKETIYMINDFCEHSDSSRNYYNLKGNSEKIKFEAANLLLSNEDIYKAVSKVKGVDGYVAEFIKNKKATEAKNLKEQTVDQLATAGADISDIIAQAAEVAVQAEKQKQADIVAKIFNAAESNPELAGNLKKLGVNQDDADAYKKLKPLIEDLVSKQHKPAQDTDIKLEHGKKLGK